MSDIINIKDFYDHETRISIVENAIIEIKKELKDIRKNIDSQFKWIMSAFGGLALGGVGILITLIFRLH